MDKTNSLTLIKPYNQRKPTIKHFLFRQPSRATSDLPLVVMRKARWPRFTFISGVLLELLLSSQCKNLQEIDANHLRGTLIILRLAVRAPFTTELLQKLTRQRQPNNAFPGKENGTITKRWRITSPKISFR